MRTSARLVVDVRRSLCLTLLLAGLVAGSAVAMYLVVSAIAGRVAGLAAAVACAGVLTLARRAQARHEPCSFAIGADGSVEWTDRGGQSAAGRVVAAARAGGLWVSLRVRPANRAWPLSRARRPRVRAWLIAADATDPETFRALAASVPRMTGGPC